MNGQKLTAANLVSAIVSLKKNVNYNYVNSSNTHTIQIVHVEKPEGPIKIKRGDTETSISKQAIWRLADALSTGEPVNVDRVFGASYNFRSALEALLAHTPEIYWCKLQRIQPGLNKSEVVEGHKHIIWLPDRPHEKGVMKEYGLRCFIPSFNPFRNRYRCKTPPRANTDCPFSNRFSTWFQDVDCEKRPRY